MIEYIDELISEKEKLIDKIKEQMRSDVENGILSAETLDIFNIAALNLEAAKMKLKEKNEKSLKEAVYLFGRLSWNLGEFIARAAEDKKKKWYETVPTRRG